MRLSRLSLQTIFLVCRFLWPFLLLGALLYVLMIFSLRNLLSSCSFSSYMFFSLSARINKSKLSCSSSCCGHFLLLNLKFSFLCGIKVITRVSQTFCNISVYQDKSQFFFPIISDFWQLESTQFIVFL